MRRIKLDRFLNAFFFSAHTLTTVGYGNISPGSISANMLAVIEALIGLLGFALATGNLVRTFFQAFGAHRIQREGAHRAL